MAGKLTEWPQNIPTSPKISQIGICGLKNTIWQPCLGMGEVFLIKRKKN
jgi:hypothetical protein